ncbi:Uncharacterised protein [Actinomyces bovis]|uniref:WXG100 family type VII secretion target n=1 Tax=Actinomyces bovis TaxID=1658 RepID=A0ABY1VNN7_9ACTO|nr:DUF6507 family protein [Actinomyces bovis]SPT53730.1 Uncharacterised protein [Actinomyces bovis]VEG55891.1 Uncharacterised protein [Actinomyces israelii]
MSAWNIAPESVSTVLSGVKKEVDDNLSPAMAGVVTALTNVYNATHAEDKAPLVAAAVSGWYDNHETNFSDIGDWISNTVSNTKNAVSAYLKHDEDTALQYQRNAK